MPSVPKTVIFDLGKVLLDFDYTIAARRLIKNKKLKLIELARLFTAPADLLARYETGLLTTPQFYSQICNITGYDRSLEEFSTSFADIFTPIKEMVDVHTSLHDKKIPTYIFSNTNELAINHIRRTYPFFSDFDGYILSYEQHVEKPDPAIYEVVERVTKMRGSDLLYIDDRPENIEAGRKRGWQVILQENPAKTFDQLRKTGILS